MGGSFLRDLQERDEVVVRGEAAPEPKIFLIFGNQAMQAPILLAPSGALSRRIDRDNRIQSHPIPLIALTVPNHSIVI